MNKAKSVFGVICTYFVFTFPVLSCETSYLIQHVTAADKYNSRGNPITDNAAYLQQDRYWFHAKSRKDPMDGDDHIATTKEARAWYGNAVREAIDPETAYIMQQGDFIAVVSFDQCSAINANGNREWTIFINFVDVSPYEQDGYQPSFRHYDAEQASELSGLDEYQTDPLAKQAFEAFVNLQSISFSPSNVVITYLPRVELYVAQVGCETILCPFLIFDSNGASHSQFNAKFGFRYVEKEGKKMLLNEFGEQILQF